MRWMNLESVTQSEISHKEKNKYHIYMESRKIVLKNLCAGQGQRDRHREQTCGHSWGRRGWDELRETFTLPYIKQIASGKLLYNTRSSTQCSVTT